MDALGHEGLILSQNPSWKRLSEDRTGLQAGDKHVNSDHSVDKNGEAARLEKASHNGPDERDEGRN